MRFAIEVPDELLRGGAGTGAVEAAAPPSLSGGAAMEGVLLGAGPLAEALPAGAAEGGGVLASLDGEVMDLDGGAAPA